LLVNSVDGLIEEASVPDPVPSKPRKKAISQVKKLAKVQVSGLPTPSNSPPSNDLELVDEGNGVTAARMEKAMNIWNETIPAVHSLDKRIVGSFLRFLKNSSSAKKHLGRSQIQTRNRGKVDPTIIQYIPTYPPDKEIIEKKLDLSHKIVEGIDYYLLRWQDEEGQKQDFVAVYEAHLHVPLSEVQRWEHQIFASMPAAQDAKHGNEPVNHHTEDRTKFQGSANESANYVLDITLEYSDSGADKDPDYVEGKVKAKMKVKKAKTTKRKVMVKEKPSLQQVREIEVNEDDIYEVEIDENQPPEPEWDLTFEIVEVDS
jgi:hypothetical protein